MKMKRIMRVGILLLVAAVAQAASTSGLNSSSLTALMARVPHCAIGCLLDGYHSAHCPIDKITDCVCTDIPLQARSSQCVQQSCEFNDQIATVNVSQELCKDYPIEEQSRPAKFFSVALPTMTLVVVLLRCVARIQVASRLWWDDGAALMAMVLAGNFDSNIRSRLRKYMLLLPRAALTRGINTYLNNYLDGDLGFGHHYWNIDPAHSKTILQIIYVLQMLYIFVQGFAKISIACFYYRVFTGKTFRLKINIFLIFLTTRSLMFLLLVIFQCTPIQSIWNRAIPSQCLNLSAISSGGAACSILEDIVLIVLPVPELMRLQLDKKKKVALFGMFALGSFACVASMIRLKQLVYFAHTFDPTWDYVGVIDWSCAELNAAVMCSSLPALRPLFVKALVLVSSRTWSGRATSAGDKSHQHQQRHGFAMANIGSHPSRSHQASAQSWPKDVAQKPVRLDSLEIESSAPSEGKSSPYYLEAAIERNGSDLDSGPWSASAASTTFNEEQIKDSSIKK
ncbi:integral membrane protein [Colletotrichum scovillei]|nr:integral membrane protein [Colletotrichum scovillei]